MANSEIGLMSIMTKVVVQINAKLGGEPWATHNPLKASVSFNFFFESYPCTRNKKYEFEHSKLCPFSKR